MLKINPKTRCIKLNLSKSTDVCRCYSDLQSEYAGILEARDDVESYTCNMPLNGLAMGNYTSDFCVKLIDGTLVIRECVNRNHLTKPMTVHLLDASRDYWNRRGVTDWGLVIEKELINVQAK